MEVSKRQSSAEADEAIVEIYKQRLQQQMEQESQQQLAAGECCTQSSESTTASCIKPVNTQTDNIVINMLRGKIFQLLSIYVDAADALIHYVIPCFWTEHPFFILKVNWLHRRCLHSTFILAAHGSKTFPSISGFPSHFFHVLLHSIQCHTACTAACLMFQLSPFYPNTVALTLYASNRACFVAISSFCTISHPEEPTYKHDAPARRP